MLHIASDIRKFCYGLSVAVLPILSGCSSTDMPYPVDGEGEDGIILEFMMRTRNAESAAVIRSAEIPAAPNPEIGFAVENYLDLEKMMFLIFDNEGNMLRTFKPEISAIDDASAPYIKYRIRTFLHDKYFLESTDENISFTIVALGNYSNLSPEQFGYHEKESLTDIFNPDNVGTFSIPVSNNAEGTWIPTILSSGEQGSGHLPMSGMQTFTVGREKLRNSSLDNPCKLSEGSSAKYINMLRALAKIEIVDKMPLDEAGEDNYTIDKVELIGYATRGSIFPTYDQWASGLETQYVTAPSVPSSSEYRGVAPILGNVSSVEDEDAIIKFFQDEDATGIRDDGCNVFSCYLTEYDPDMIGTVPQMWLRITLKSVLTDRKVQYRMEVAPYSGGKPENPLKILRNNIYRYVITGMNEVSLDIQPFAKHDLSFGFGLIRDARGDLMVLPDKDGAYPDYFLNFVRTHGLPKVEDEDGNLTNEDIELRDGDYYAIVVGENEEMSQATIWVKDREGCHVLSNFGSDDNTQACSARHVENFYNNNESEKFYKDQYGYRRVYHFSNHNSIVRHPKLDNLLFCHIENFQQEGEIRKYLEVESWDDTSHTGWIVTKDADGTETGFQRITSEGTLGETVPLN